VPTPSATIQLCTYNRARLLERVLAACFEQTVSPADYEVVVVDDGSGDETPVVLAAAAAKAECGFTVVTQANAGLARARNAGIARAQGQRLIFIDDDVLPMPNFVAEHLRAGADSVAIVRGAAVETESFDDLPPPVYGLRNYSGNFFWTTNVSVGRARLLAVGGFDETFDEYGWEDVELGLRLRRSGTRAIFNPRAIAFHWKPRPRAGDVPKMIRQSQAQARMAVRLAQLQPHWRTALATGDNPAQRAFHRATRRFGLRARLQSALSGLGGEQVLSGRQAAAARALATEAYFEELERACASFSPASTASAI
jgi:glycosyltransferase involved in cell wall biosynthesis